MFQNVVVSHGLSRPSGYAYAFRSFFAQL